MSTDTQDMLTRLQLAAAQQNQPAFAGIQAPTDPAAMQNILSQLQNNMAVQQAGNTGNDQYSFLRNAGAKDFQRAANSFGSAGQQAANVIN